MQKVKTGYFFDSHCSFYHVRMRIGDGFGRIILCRVSVFSDAITFENLDLHISFLLRLENIPVILFECLIHFATGDKCTHVRLASRITHTQNTYVCIHAIYNVQVFVQSWAPAEFFSMGGQITGLGTNVTRSVQGWSPSEGLGRNP